jgi:predicted ATPase
MRVKSIEIEGFRAFKHMDRIELGDITVLIGPNNSGKSSILRALSLMQDGSGVGGADVRVGYGTANIRIDLEKLESSSWRPPAMEDGYVAITLSSSDRRGMEFSLSLMNSQAGGGTAAQIPSIEPNHFVVPYLTKRKTALYQEDVRSQHAMRISPTMEFLAAKLSRISNPSFPGHHRYAETCKAILGFMVTAVPSDNGQRPGIYLPNKEIIPIDQMGEGVPNIVALLADLALSDGKLFLVEEPENDLHPSALKALLDLLIESSKRNQFVVSTHSNIVLRHLGGVPETRVYEVSPVDGSFPVEGAIRIVEPTPQARLEVLRAMGYSFSDFDLWDGWLFLEEASAERIIRDYLIPWFAPSLVRVRTLSAAGATNVEPTFEDFQRLVRFTHLEQAYANAAWVRVDGDQTGKDVVARLKGRYSSWNPDRFACFEQPQFERYYPVVFHERVTSTISMPDRQQRREAKRLLLEDVRKWLDEDAARGKHALQQSATEVIADLKTIASQLPKG